MNANDDDLLLAGLDGSNPLGFMAALGVIAALDASPNRPKLAWVSGSGWQPRLKFPAPVTSQTLADQLHAAVCGRAVAADAMTVRRRTEKDYSAAKKRVKNKRSDILRRKLKAPDRDAAFAQELEPLERTAAEKREVWMAALETAVASPELALGKDLSASVVEFRTILDRHAQTASHQTRATVNLLAHFGCDSCFDARTQRIEVTPLCFVTGSGHQHFLETAGNLMARVTVEQVHDVLFQPWRYEDERLSMRWDPVEDRRYALMWNNPSNQGNEAKTVWAANLLAYRGLELLSSVPVGSHLATTGFSRRRRREYFTWPLWEDELDLDTIRSLLMLAELQSETPDRDLLLRRGIREICRCERIQVGKPPLHKINFTPTQPV
jgi:hypothetical protein